MQVPCTLSREKLILTTLKSTSRRQGWKGDRPSEGSRRANLRAASDVRDGHPGNCIRPNPRASQQSRPREALWVQHDEARLDHWGMVNAAVVQGKIMFLHGWSGIPEICQPKLLNGSGGTAPARVRVNMAEVSRGREPGVYPGERSEGSVIVRCL